MIADCVPGRRQIREGYALMAVLWILLPLSSLAMAVVIYGRESTAVARNRSDMEKARWAAEGCLHVAVSALEQAWRVAPREGRFIDRVWQRADSIIDAALDRSALHAIGFAQDCRPSVRPSGALPNVNVIEQTLLAQYLQSIGMAAMNADSLAAAIVDWRDLDEVEHALGAESGWYRAHGRPGPRNQPFEDIREVTLVRGAPRELINHLAIDTSRVPINHATIETLRTIPELPAQLLDSIVGYRARGQLLFDLTQLVAGFPLGSTSYSVEREWLFRRFTTDPEFWTIEIAAKSGEPPLTIVVEAKLQRVNRRPSLQQTRWWLE